MRGGKRGRMGDRGNGRQGDWETERIGEILYLNQFPVYGNKYINVAFRSRY
jgi:hypothetical protein